MPTSGKKKFPVQHPMVLDLGCSCRRTKLSYLFSFPPLRPKHHSHSVPKQQHHPFWSYYPFSPSTVTTVATSPFDTSHHPSSTSATTPSPYDDYPSSSPRSDAPWATKRKARAGSAEEKPATRGPGGKGGRVAESVEVVKESHDPYMDFRESMLQMIVEKEIYAWEDLRELLHRLLALNNPCHHAAIVRAFSEIYNGIFAAAT